MLTDLVLVGAIFVVFVIAIAYVAALMWYRHRWLPRHERAIKRRQATFTSQRLKL